MPASSQLNCLKHFIYIIFQVYVCPVVFLGGKGVRVSTPFINTFPQLPFLGNEPFHLSPPFNTTTIIKQMNEKEEEAPLEDPCVHQNHWPPLKDPHVHWNHLARERHAARYEEQCVADANQQITQLFKIECFFEINTVLKNQGTSQCSKVTSTHQLFNEYPMVLIDSTIFVIITTCSGKSILLYLGST